MNKHNPVSPPQKSGNSLLERAADAFAFAPRPFEPGAAQPVPPVKPSTAIQPAPIPRPFRGREAKIDRGNLAAAGLLQPDAPVGNMAEEFRLVKRQLLLAANGTRDRAAVERGRMILIGSAQPNDGKTYCAINLALSMASEKDSEVLLVDADFVQPSILSTLGLEADKGLLDAFRDPSIDVGSLIIKTDIPGLSVLPAGSQGNDDTELVAARHAGEVLEELMREDPRRIILFDTPPVLLASPAATLALHVGQVLLVVRADKTTEADIGEALSMLDRCGTIHLLLNGTNFSSGRRFGSYYGYGE